MTLKEKLTYSFMAISIVLGSNAYAADNRDDSALIGSTSGAPNTHLPSADLALFDPEAFKSSRILLSGGKPQEKTAIPHAEAMHLPDAPLTSVSSSSSSAAAAAKKKVGFEDSVVDHRDDKEKHMHLSDSVSSSSSSSSAAAAAKRGVVKESDDGAEQAAEDRDEMSLPQALQVISELPSILPGSSIQVSGIPVTKKPSSKPGLMLSGFDDDEQEHSASRDDRQGTRREDHHGDTHTLARRGEFQEPLGESRRDDSDVPDLLRIRSGTSRVTYHEDEKLILELKLKLNLLRYGGLEEHNLVLMTDGLIESLLSNRLIAQQAGEVCIESLNSIYGLTHTVKVKKGEATALYSKRAKIVDYIRAKVTEDFTFINVLLKLADQDRFYRTVHKGLTRESVGLSAEEHLIFDKTKGGLSLQYNTLTLAGLGVHQAVLMPTVDVIVRTVPHLRELARIHSTVFTLYGFISRLVEAESLYNIKEELRFGHKTRIALGTFILGLIEIPKALPYPSHSAVVQERVECKEKTEEKAVAKPKTDHI